MNRNTQFAARISPMTGSCINTNFAKTLGLGWVPFRLGTLSHYRTRTDSPRLDEAKRARHAQRYLRLATDTGAQSPERFDAGAGTRPAVSRAGWASSRLVHALDAHYRPFRNFTVLLLHRGDGESRAVAIAQVPIARRHITQAAVLILDDEHHFAGVR